MGWLFYLQTFPIFYLTSRFKYEFQAGITLIFKQTIAC